MEEYKFYPDQSNPYYKRICDEVALWIKTNCDRMPLRNLNRLLGDEKLAYDYYVQEQKRRLLNTSVYEHFEAGKQFLEKMAKPHALEKFDKKFDDYYRFFPEQVFKMASAIAFCEYNSIKNRSLNKFYDQQTAVKLRVINAVLKNMLAKYSEKGGNMLFISNYYYNSENQIIEKYGLPLDGIFTTKPIRNTEEYEPFRMSKEFLNPKDPYLPIRNLIDSFIYDVNNFIFFNSICNRSETGIAPEKFYGIIDKNLGYISSELENHDKDMIRSYIPDVYVCLKCRQRTPVQKEIAKSICDYLVDSLSGPKDAKQKEDNFSALIELMQSK